MGKKRKMRVPFPLGGLNRKASYRQQAPYTSPDLLNVRSDATLEGRERGGSRPGLVYSHREDIGSNIRMLHPMTISFGDSFTFFSDTFGGLSLASAWTQASWASAVPTILTSELASVDTSITEGEIVLDILPIDTASNYEVEAMFTPWAGEWHGSYRLYLRLDDVTPAYATDGVFIEITQTGATGAYTASLISYSGGISVTVDTDTGTIAGPSAGWLSATVAADVVTVYWQGTLILTGAVDAHAGTRVGFGMSCSVAEGLCLCNVFRVQYYSTGNVDSLRTQLIASCGGDMYREGPYGRLTVVTTDLTVRDDVPMKAAQAGQVLYVADYGDLRDTGTDGTMSGAILDEGTGQDWSALGIDTDSDICVLSAVGGGTTAGAYAITTVHAVNGLTLDPDPGDGTCTYRVERGPKIYDPVADTMSLWIATAATGQVPTGCPLIARFQDRVFLAGAAIAPHIWYCPRAGDPLDWDYSQSDSGAAVAGSASDAGVPGDPLTAMFAFSDDYLIFGCLNSIWRLNGDPAYGGKLDNLSQSIGIIDTDAWTRGPNGELIFLSLGGLYAVMPGGNSYPTDLSGDSLPAEFKSINPAITTVQLEYDVADRGVHIFITEDSSNTRTHWWFNWDGKTFWPQTLQSDHEPTATCSYQASATEESGVLLGGRDGKLRRFSGLSSNDTGTAFSSYAKIGPIPLAPDDQVGTVLAIDPVMAAASGDVAWSIHPADTFQGAVSADASDSGTWEAGLNAREMPSARGQAAVLELTGTANERWAYESSTITVMASGRRLVS